MPKKKILVVDNEPGVSDGFEKALTQEGYEVISSLSGLEALEKVKQEKPNLVMLGLKMPGLAGIETIRQIKNINKKARVFVFTAEGTLDSAEEALREGADDYITKPFKLTYLKTAIKESLG